jgi:hypothetical protein
MGLSRQELIAIARVHAAVETDGDLEATMATLDPDPVYELQPIGLMLRGTDSIRSFYQYLMEHLLPRVVGANLRSEWVGDDGLAQEYTIDVSMPSGEVECHALIGVLVFGDRGLAGERIWASERMLRMLFGPFYDLAVPIDGPR